MPAVQRTMSIGLDAEEIALQSGQREIGRDAEEDRIVGEMEDAVFQIAMAKMTRDAERRQRHRAPRQHAGGDAELDARRSSVEFVFNSGVSRMPPIAQIEMKKNAVAARNMSSVLSRTDAVTRSSARNMAAPNASLRSALRP